MRPPRRILTTVRTRKLARDPAVKLTGTIPSGRFGKRTLACQLHHLHFAGICVGAFGDLLRGEGEPEPMVRVRNRGVVGPCLVSDHRLFLHLSRRGRKKKHGPKSRLHVVVRSTGQNELSVARMQKEQCGASS